MSLIDEFTDYLDQQIETWRAHGPGNEGCSPHVAVELESVRTFWRNTVRESEAAGGSGGLREAASAIYATLDKLTHLDQRTPLGDCISLINPALTAYEEAIDALAAPSTGDEALRAALRYADWAGVWTAFLVFNDDATWKGSGFTGQQVIGARAFMDWFRETYLTALRSEPIPGRPLPKIEPRGYHLATPITKAINRQKRARPFTDIEQSR